MKPIQTILIGEHQDLDALRDEEVRIALTVLEDHGWTFGLTKATELPTITLRNVRMERDNTPTPRERNLALQNRRGFIHCSAMEVALFFTASLLGWKLGGIEGAITGAGFDVLFVITVGKFTARLKS